MIRGLLVLLSIAVCTAKYTESGLYIPAPYFNEGENLSVQNCANETTVGQWTVTVRHNKWYAFQVCSAGIAISQRAVLVTGLCSISEFKAGDLRIFYCWETQNEECISSSIKVKEVFEICINPKAHVAYRENLTLIVTEKMPSEVTPICLFNRDNIVDLQRQIESPYLEWRLGSTSDFIDPSPKIVTGQKECLESLNQKEVYTLMKINFPAQNVLCVKNGSISHNILINVYKGRYYLRGFKPVFVGSVIFDLVPYIDEIARNAKDISTLRSMPQPKPIRGFAAPDNLSFPDCGVKNKTTRRKREYDDSSEESTPITHVFGGSTAHCQLDGHPWHAYVENYLTDETCGGTLISPKAILTAAHCIFKSDAWVFGVTIGMYDRLRRRKGSVIQKRKPMRLIVHPNYSSGQLNSDVGLMIFRKQFKITDHVRPICLWNEDSSLNLVAGKKATVVGFGLIDGYILPNKLQEARLPIRAHKECYLSHRRFFGKYLRPGDNFCAGHRNGTSTCNGDNGGSLSVEKNGRWFIRGIVSFGKSKIVQMDGKNISLCHPNHFSVFADVAGHVNWIVENTPDISFEN